jgi:hypothetical protein
MPDLVPNGLSDVLRGKTVTRDARHYDDAAADTQSNCATVAVRRSYLSVNSDKRDKSGARKLASKSVEMIGTLSEKLVECRAQ